MVSVTFLVTLFALCVTSATAAPADTAASCNWVCQYADGDYYYTSGGSEKCASTYKFAANTLTGEGCD